MSTAAMRALVRRMKAIREPRMRQVIAAEFLRSGTPSQVVATLRELLRETQVHADPAYYATADAIAEALSVEDAIVYDRRTDLYTAARTACADQVARLFFSHTPTEPQAIDDDSLEAERRIEPRGKVLTLGERKALARTHRRSVIEHMLRDPHPEVITVLLDNPHMTEPDVVVVASRRPSPGALLERIARHARWRLRYPVKRALVLNPHTPAHLGLRLLATLRPSDLRAITRDAALAEVVRRQAQDLLDS